MSTLNVCVCIHTHTHLYMGFLGGTNGKNPPPNAGDTCSIPGCGKSHEGEHGNPLQYSCLKNPMDRGAWRAAVHRIAKSQTWLSK